MKRYDKYKPSGIDWIGEVPEHWDITKVKYVVKSIGSGGTPTSGNEAFYSDEGTPWVAIGDMSDADFVYDTQKHLTKEGIADKSLTIYPKGTLLYSIYATLGKVAVLAIPATINQAILAIVLKDSYNQDFFKYNLKAMERYVFSQSNGNTQFNLSAQKVSNFEVLNCSLAEQEAIAAYLDARCGDIDKVVATQQKRIALLQELKQSEITQAVTRGLNPDARMKNSGVEWIGMVPEHWEVKKLRFLGSTKNGISKGGDYFGKGYPFVSYGDVYKNYALPTMVDGLVESSDEERKDFSVEKGDVFFTRTSETIEEVGFSSVCPKTIKDAVFAGFVIRFRPKKDVLNIGFSKYYFRCDLHRAFFVKEMNLVTRASLSQELLKNLIVLLPPFDEQVAIAEYLDRRCGEIDKQIGAVTKQIELLREYKQALITEVVTGKRKVC